MRAVLLAGTTLALTLLGGAASARDSKTFLGFRLLDLESQTVKWQTPAYGRNAVVTYAFATAPLTTPGARNCASMLPPEAALAPSQITKDAFRREVAGAFRMWEKVAGIAFRETADETNAGILIGAQAEPVAAPSPT